MTTLLISTVAFFVAILLVVGFRHVSRRRLTSERKREDIKTIHDPVSGEVSLDVLADVIHAVGIAYRIDPALIRPHDSLERFADADSWVLGEGAERLEEWLASKGMGNQPLDVSSVLELARLVEKTERRKS